MAHSGVMWWEGKAADETSTLMPSRSILGLSAEEFAIHAIQLPILHFEAARLLMPRLLYTAAQRPRSYTFVTGGAGTGSGGLAQVNAQALWGLSAALQHETAGEALTVSELRVELQLNRAAAERNADPRPVPLSHELGTIVAGFAGSSWRAASGLHKIAAIEDVAALRERYPVIDEPYDVHESC